MAVREGYGYQALRPGAHGSALCGDRSNLRIAIHCKKLNAKCTAENGSGALGMAMPGSRFIAYTVRIAVDLT